MNPLPGTEGYPPWMQLVGALSFIVSMGVFMAWNAWRGQKTGAQAASETQASAEALAQRATAVVAMSPTADKLTQDALVQTMASLTLAIDRLTTLLEQQERDREEDERAELRELRRMRDRLEGPRDPMRRDQR